jgi:hypothetical protein
MHCMMKNESWIAKLDGKMRQRVGWKYAGGERGVDMDPPSIACLHAALKKSPNKEQSRTTVDSKETNSQVLEASLVGAYLARRSAARAWR